MRGFDFEVKTWEQNLYIHQWVTCSLLEGLGGEWGVGSLVNTKFMINAKGYGGVDMYFDLNGG